MSDSENIIKRDSEKILNSKQYEKIASSSLLSKFKARNSKECLLIDTSGSMADHLGDSRTRHSVMQDTLSNIEGYRRFSFNTNCKEIKSEDVLPRPSGGTNLALAFATVKAMNMAHIILVTDGQPDSEAAALDSAKGLKIDIIYIGPDPMPLFLKKLAEVSGGSYENIALNKAGAAALLVGKIKGFLGSGS